MDAKELYKALKKAVGKKPIKMKDLAAKIGIVKDGEPVGTSDGARIRVQLKKLEADGIITHSGERALTRYFKV